MIAARIIYRKMAVFVHETRRQNSQKKKEKKEKEKAQTQDKINILCILMLLEICRKKGKYKTCFFLYETS